MQLKEAKIIETPGKLSKIKAHTLMKMCVEFYKDEANIKAFEERQVENQREERNHKKKFT